MMENCNYDRPEMMVFNLARKGLLGDIVHAECGYLHDLRAIKFEDRDEGLWVGVKGTAMSCMAACSGVRPPL
jgi:hypothetical protein